MCMHKYNIKCIKLEKKIRWLQTPVLSWIFGFNKFHFRLKMNVGKNFSSHNFPTDLSNNSAFPSFLFIIAEYRVTDLAVSNASSKFELDLNISSYNFETVIPNSSSKIANILRNHLTWKVYAWFFFLKTNYAYRCPTTICINPSRDLGNSPPYPYQWEDRHKVISLNFYYILLNDSLKVYDAQDIESINYSLYLVWKSQCVNQWTVDVDDDGSSTCVTPQDRRIAGKIHFHLLLFKT